MIPTIDKQMTEIGEFPKRENFTVFWDYSVAMDAALAKMNPYSLDWKEVVVEINNAIEYFNADVNSINESTPVLLSAINYKGEWSNEITNEEYPYTKNSSVSIGDDIYVSKIDNNTDGPAESINWLHVPRAYTKTESNNLLNDKANKEQTYTKEETNTLLENKADTEYVATELTKQSKLLFEKALFGGL